MDTVTRENVLRISWPSELSCDLPPHNPSPLLKEKKSRLTKDYFWHSGKKWRLKIEVNILVVVLTHLKLVSVTPISWYLDFLLCEYRHHGGALSH
jgi:hypothetical protein